MNADYRSRSRQHATTPRGARLPSTEAACLAEIRSAELAVAESRRPFNGDYSARAYAQHQQSKRDAETRLSTLQRHLRRLRGEIDQYGDEIRA